MRNCNDWIDTFCEYVSNTETPKIYAKWSAISAIAAVLRKKCCFKLGRLTIYPNLYILLVGLPGHRKSISLNYAKELIMEAVPGLPFSAESNTRERLLMDLEASAMDFILPSGETFRSSALTVLSKEFESFIGNKKENIKMIVTLTDLFDHSDAEWKHLTKHSGSTSIPNVYLNIAGCTTPKSLASSLTLDAIGGGLTSRIIFVYCGQKEKLVPIPEIGEKEEKLRKILIEDLNIISNLSGVYNFTENSRKQYVNWYLTQYQSKNKICKDDAFAGWYERKPLFLQKLAIICQSAINDSLNIEWDIFQRALAFIEDVEQYMALSFRGVGRSDLTEDVDMVYSIISSRDYISDSELQGLIWRDVDSHKMDAIMATLHRSRSISVLSRSPSGEAGLFYKAIKKL